MNCFETFHFRNYQFRFFSLDYALHELIEITVHVEIWSEFCVKTVGTKEQLHLAFVIFLSTDFDKASVKPCTQHRGEIAYVTGPLDLFKRAARGV